MGVIIAKTAGFCFGVKRAVNMLDDALENKNDKIATLGPIIHNEQVVNDFKSRGVAVFETPEEVPEGTLLVLRSHGFSKELYERVLRLNIRTIDATCPFVKKIHRIVIEHYKKGSEVVILGDSHHPEVKGINGWCGNTAVICNDMNRLKKSIEADKKYCVVAQTTIEVSFFKDAVEYIKSINKDAVIFDTICSATSERQKEASEIAEKVDLMLVVGGLNSSNTKKLVQVCENYCPMTYWIQTAEDMEKNGELKDRLEKADNIGITAGASTPASIIKEVYKQCQNKTKLWEM